MKPWKSFGCFLFRTGGGHIAHGAVALAQVGLALGGAAPSPATGGFEPHALAARETDAAHLRDHRRLVPFATVLVAEDIDRARATARDALGRRGAAFAEDEHL